MEKVPPVPSPNAWVQVVVVRSFPSETSLKTLEQRARHLQRWQDMKRQSLRHLLCNFRSTSCCGTSKMLGL